jgi:hypothetical protein
MLLPDALVSHGSAAQVFYAGDTLCTKLKTAHDYKLSMRTNYLTTQPAMLPSRRFINWMHILTLMRCDFLLRICHLQHPTQQGSVSTTNFSCCWGSMPPAAQAAPACRGDRQYACTFL